MKCITVALISILTGAEVDELGTISVGRTRAAGAPSAHREHAARHHLARGALAAGARETRLPAGVGHFGVCVVGRRCAVGFGRF